MSYYWFNIEELLKKAKKKYHENVGKEKGAKYYRDNKETTKKQETSIKI